MKPIRKQYFDDGRAPETVFDTTAPARTVTAAEQLSTGMVKRSNFVAPAEITTVAKRGPAQLLPVQETSHTLDVPMQATQHIEMKTSAVDRSKGFLIANVPLFGAFAVGVWLLSGLVTSTPLLSFLGLCILWSSFVLAWLASYAYTLHMSVEGVSMWEARAKWRVIAEEQRRRWEYYERIEGDDDGT